MVRQSLMKRFTRRTNDDHYESLEVRFLRIRKSGYTTWRHRHQGASSLDAFKLYLDASAPLDVPDL